MGNGSLAWIGSNQTDDSIARRSKQVRFLVIHENAPVRKLIKSILRNMGFPTVLEESVAGNFLDTLVKEKVHVLICSGGDPHEQDWDWVKALRAQEHTQKTGVIIISSLTEKDVILDAVRAGVDDYIVMPFSALVFEERIDTLLQKKQLIS
ncbi:MAG: response regulator [Candidatus Tectomicrobia bacterium]|uniref:Response regulator n=1 Tax=Tectimicrobiota bacterium TaxID=2528274 RepID=A0A932LZN3_UNCTE|nr:response regulator [Candidatus Tectomicrobia bacterium]